MTHELDELGSSDKSLRDAMIDAEKDGVVEVHNQESNEALAQAEGIDAHFMVKAQVINEALEECGMGRFQVLRLTRHSAHFLADRPHRRSGSCS